MDKIPGGAWIAAAIVIVGLAYIFFVARPSLVHEECEALASKKSAELHSRWYGYCVEDGGASYIIE